VIARQFPVLCGAAFGGRPSGIVFRALDLVLCRIFQSGVRGGADLFRHGVVERLRGGRDRVLVG